MKKSLLILIIMMLVITVTACDNMQTDLSSLGIMPVVRTFEVTPSVITTGEISYLKWNVSNADKVSIDNGIGNVAVSGNIPVTPVSTTIYTLTATNWAGNVTAQTRIIVSMQDDADSSVLLKEPPVINIFTADGVIVMSGEPVVLSWNVSNAEKVILSNVGEVLPADKYIVYPVSSSNYTLTAMNDNGNSTAVIIVSIMDSGDHEGIIEITLSNISGESGSVIKGTNYLSYTRQAKVCAGDTSSYLASRAFLSFNISSIPEGATIKEAILDFSGYSKIGDPSYMRSNWGNMGALEVYHLQYGGYEDLGMDAYNRKAQLTKNGRFIDYPLSPWAWDVKESDDNEQVIQELVNKRSARSQFRIQFFTSTNWDGISDMLCFDNAKLTIRYIVP